MSIAEKLITVAENVPMVFEAGKEAEHDRFWDAFQDLGNRTAYAYGFCGVGWNDDTFKPKYPIICSGSSAFMFRDSLITCKDSPLQIDLSQATSVAATFYYSKLENVGTLDLSSGNDLNTFFQYAYNIANVEKIIIKDDGSQTFTNAFQGCSELTEIRFEGVIGKSLDIHWSTKLSMLSLASIVGALSKTVSGQSITLPTTARDTYDSATISGSWDNLVAQYPNWSFKYS